MARDSRLRIGGWLTGVPPRGAPAGRQRGGHGPDPSPVPDGGAADDALTVTVGPPSTVDNPVRTSGGEAPPDRTVAWPEGTGGGPEDATRSPGCAGRLSEADRLPSEGAARPVETPGWPPHGAGVPPETPGWPPETPDWPSEEVDRPSEGADRASGDADPGPNDVDPRFAGADRPWESVGPPPDAARWAASAAADPGRPTGTARSYRGRRRRRRP